MNIYHTEMLIKTLIFFLTPVIAWILYIEMNKTHEGFSKEWIEENKPVPIAKDITDKNEKCKSIKTHDKCKLLDSDDLTCGYCEGNDTYYYGHSSALTDNQTWDHTKDQPYLFFSKDENVKKNSTCPGGYKPPSKNINKNTRVKNCEMEIERMACASVTKCIDLDNNEINKKYGLPDNWVKNNCGFCPTMGKLKGIVIDSKTGKAKYDKIEDCGPNQIPFIKYENNDQIYLDLINEMRDIPYNAETNINITCNDILKDNPCIGANASELLTGDNNCYAWLFNNFAKGDKSGAGENSQKCSKSRQADNKENIGYYTDLSRNDVIKILNEPVMDLTDAEGNFKNWYEIKKKLSTVQDKIKSATYNTAKKFSEYCFGQSHLNPCNEKYNSAGSERVPDCKTQIWSEGFTATAAAAAEGMQCNDQGLAHPAHYTSNNSIEFDRKAGFLAPWVEHPYNKSNYSDYSEMKEMINNNDNDNALHTNYRTLMNNITSDKGPSPINDITDEPQISNYLTAKFNKLACTGELLSDNEYLDNKLKVDCWTDFLVKMVAGGYYSIKNRAGKLVLELQHTEDTSTFKYSKLLPTITEEDYNKPEFPILNYIKLTSNVDPAYKLKYIKKILDNEIKSNKGWKIGKYYVIENKKKMSNKFEALIDIVPIVNGNDIKTETELGTYINNLNANGVKYIGYIEYDPYSSQSKAMHNNSRLLKSDEQTARKTDKYIISENYIGSNDFPFFMLIKRIAGL